MRQNLMYMGTVKNIHLAFFVSSAMCPDASKPVIVPAVKRLNIMVNTVNIPWGKITYNDKIQFQPAGAPVPLSGS